MFDVLISFVLSFRSYLRTQADNQLEMLALRHQIVVLQRQNPKPKLKPADRRFWVALSQFWSRWRSALWIVKPATVIDWHRRGFRWYWTWKVRHGRPGRPCVPNETRELISYSKPRQCRLGSAKNPWRTIEAGNPDLGILR